jgi:hypothetical protein
MGSEVALPRAARTNESLKSCAKCPSCSPQPAGAGGMRSPYLSPNRPFERGDDALGITLRSSRSLNGIGTSGAPTRTTGASSQSNAASVTEAWRAADHQDCPIQTH